MNDSPYLTCRETAAYLRVTERTLTDLANAGLGPPYVRIGTRKRFRKDILEEWIAAQMVIEQPKRGAGK